MTQRSQRISYLPLEKMDGAMMAIMEQCVRGGTPRPESSAVRAHSQDVFWAFADAWDKHFRHGVVDHAIGRIPVN
jgi:hypothetical protein